MSLGLTQQTIATDRFIKPSEAGGLLPKQCDCSGKVGPLHLLFQFNLGSADHQDNHVVNVRVGGNCVEVLRGEVTLAI